MTDVAAAGAMTATLEDAVAGDEAAFARIVATYHGDMVRVAYGICGEPDLALDAVQSAWLISWRKLRTVREPDHLRAWLVAVAANEARHVVRPPALMAFKKCLDCGEIYEVTSNFRALDYDRCPRCNGSRERIAVRS
jgi:DNA-directed RNA polymerase subunit RPC12/RpoP